MGYAHLLSQGRFRITEDPKALEKRLTEHLGFLHRKYNADAIEQAAEADAADFEWPPGTFDGDAAAVAREGSLMGAIRAKREANLPNRFNAERVNALYHGDPEYDTLMDIAVNGARIELPPDVMLDRVPPALRAKQLRMPKTVMKHAFKLWKKGRGMLLREEDIPESERHLVAFHSSHWAKKVDDDPARAAPGRWLLDCASLNSDFSKDAAIKRYGKVTYPTLASILASWLKHAHEQGVPLAECRLAKDDIESAFPQFDFAPEAAMLLGVLVAEGVVFFHTTGMFGWTGCPMVFDAIGRAITRRVRRLAPPSVTNRYADDFALLALVEYISEAQGGTEGTIDLTMPGGVSLGKRVTACLRMAIIGFDVNLVSELANPNESGREKLLLHFFAFNPAESHTLAEWQCVASLAERYSQVICGTRGLVAPLQTALKKCEFAASGSVRVNSEVAFCVEMWRVYSILLWLQPESMGVPFSHIARNEPEFSIAWRGEVWTCDVIVDASFWKLCAAIRDSDSSEVLMWTTLTFPFDKSDFQNVREYLGLLLGLILLNASMDASQPRPTFKHSVHWTGDNTAALQWARSSKVKSKCGQIANLAMIWAQAYGNFEVTGTDHLAGLKMGDIDGATRDKVLTSLSPLLFREIESLPGVMDLFLLCDPSAKATPISQHKAFRKVHSCLSLAFAK